MHDLLIDFSRGHLYLSGARLGGDLRMDNPKDKCLDNIEVCAIN